MISIQAQRVKVWRYSQAEGEYFERGVAVGLSAEDELYVLVIVFGKLEAIPAHKVTFDGLATPEDYQ